MSVKFKKRTLNRQGLRSKKDSELENDDKNDLNSVENLLRSSEFVGEEQEIQQSVSLHLQSSQTVEKDALIDGNDASVETVTTVFKSSRQAAPQNYAGDATHTSEIDTSQDRDARAILERNIRINEEGTEAGVYKGQAAYKNFIKKDIAQVGANKHTGTHGPIRAPSFVRSSARFDYQPDICKDYKETGFCGYGDQCKFLHDRGDYKTGWQLEKEWDAEQARKKKKLDETAKSFLKQHDDDEANDLSEGGEGTGAGDPDAEEDSYVIPEEDAGLPFACFICRDPFTDPVVTLCKHYFCASCARSHDKKSKRCAACGKQTSGVFNKADKLIKRLAMVDGSGRETEASKAEQRRGQWETVDS